MPLFRTPLHLLRRSSSLIAAFVALASASRGQALLSTLPNTVSQATESTRLALSGFIDRLPDLLDFGLPSFAPPGTVRLYAHPKFGDLLHEDYFRLPVGAATKFNDHFELTTELAGYFTHGLGDNVGNGLYEAKIGVRSEFAVSPDAGWSTGLEYITPLSHPPIEITDGVRHVMPSVTHTRTLMANCGLIGFATLGFDFIDHTNLQPNFRENQLHHNNTVLTLGVAREWRRMHVVLRVFDGNTAGWSRENDNVFGIRPSVGIPILRRADGSPRATATFEGRAVWGPDGFETGVNTSIRVDLRYRRGKPKP